MTPTLTQNQTLSLNLTLNVTLTYKNSNPNERYTFIVYLNILRYEIINKRVQAVAAAAAAVTLAATSLVAAITSNELDFAHCN
jgi:hypothetical protein